MALRLIPPRRRCWYCRRWGRFGFVPNRLPCQAPQCKDNEACFARYRYRMYVRDLRALLHCPDCGNTSTPGIVITGGDALSGPLGDPCDSDFHPQNGYVL